MNPDQAISADARWVVFVSAATNLIPGETHPAGGLYLRDRQQGTTFAIPWLDGGAFPAGIVAAEPAISSDGRVVAFTAIVTSRASTSLVASETDTPFVFVWEQGAPAPDIVSMEANGRPTPGFQPSVSGDGLTVAYARWAVDTTPPVLSGLRANPVCIDNFSPNTTISVDATDNKGVAGVEIVLSPEGADSFSAAMRPAGGDTWTYSLRLASSWVVGRYVDYNVVATDTSGNKSAVQTSNRQSSDNYVYISSSCGIQ